MSIPKMAAENLTYSFSGGAPVLNSVSVVFPEGQITSLIGPSGSGKSTLLRCLNRLWEPPPGTIFWQGEDVTTLDVLDLRCRIGMLFQKPVALAGTVADNVGYGPGLRKQRLSHEQIAALLEMAGLAADMASRPADQLSGGQAQRMALARTLANEPEVLLLDEPTSALDPAATRRVEETVLHLRDRLGLTVIWVSHDVEQMARTADGVILLVDGAVVETGTPAHLLSGVHHHLTQDFAAGTLESKRRDSTHER